MSTLDLEQGPARDLLRRDAPEKCVFADEEPISHVYGVETHAVALYRLAGGRRQAIGLAVVIAASGGARMAVQAMKAGVVDFVEMPGGYAEGLASAERILAQTQETPALLSPRETAATRIASLTTRQRQVFDLVIAGYPSKNIAADLGISQRTVENHRAAIMRKTGSRSIPALVRASLAVA